MSEFCHLFTHRYETWLPGSLSADRPREGFLLRVEWPHDGGTARGARRGYADLMAWPELGDLTIEEELLAILRGEPTTLGRRAIEMARLDADARWDGRSLWDGVAEPPPSHLLAGSLADLPELDLEAASARGFSSVKVKWPSGTRPEEAARLLSTVLPGFARRKLLLRIDFNGTATLDSLASVLSNVDRSLLKQIEFLEDPFPAGDLASWRSIRAHFPQLALFVDRADREDDELLDLADGWVLKPALQGRDWIERAGAAGKPLCFTQYLGHAVGAAWAAWHAAVAGARPKTGPRTGPRTGPETEPESGPGADGALRHSGLLFDSRIAGESSFFSEALSTSTNRFATGRLRAGAGVGWIDADFDSISWSPWR